MRLSVEELANEISSFVNGASIDEVEELAKAMSSDHPTLQQSKMKLACLFIEIMANKTHVDARNESSHKTAKAMINGYKENEIRNYIDRDGGISDSLKKYIEEKATPSNSLPLI